MAYALVWIPAGVYPEQRRRAGMTISESTGANLRNCHRDHFLIISLRSLFTGSWLLRSGVSMMMYFIFATLR
jgi:hypothetical protein